MQKLSVSRRYKVTAVGAAIVVAVPALASSASAVIAEPPAAPLEVLIFPQRDFVATGGGPAGLALKFQIQRRGVVIGTAQSTQTTPDLRTGAGGILEVNHPGGLCWQGVTPNILPGDRLVVTRENDPAVGYAVVTQNVRATQAQIVGSNVVVRGVALNTDGTVTPLARVEQRIVQPTLTDAPDPLPRRDLRATRADGNLVRDPAVRGGFIATHRGLSAVQRQKAVDGQTRVLGWMRTNVAGDRLGITIYEAGELGGPGFPGCPAARDYAVTSFSATSVRVGNTGLTVSGTARNATSARVTLRDSRTGTADRTAAATLRGPAAAQTFRASFTTRQLRRLADGRLTAIGSYTVGGTAIGGVNKAIRKDMRIPGSPRSDTPSGAYRRAQSVVLSRRAGESATSKIYFTTNGNRPTTNSLRFVRPIRVAATKTLRAIVVDAAGNRSVSRCAAPRRGCWRIAIRR